MARFEDARAYLLFYKKFEDHRFLHCLVDGDGMMSDVVDAQRIHPDHGDSVRAIEMTMEKCLYRIALLQQMVVSGLPEGVTHGLAEQMMCNEWAIFDSCSYTGPETRAVRHAMHLVTSTTDTAHTHSLPYGSKKRKFVEFNTTVICNSSHH